MPICETANVDCDQPALQGKLFPNDFRRPGHILYQCVGTHGLILSSYPQESKVRYIPHVNDKLRGQHVYRHFRYTLQNVSFQIMQYICIGTEILHLLVVCGYFLSFNASMQLHIFRSRV